MANIIANQHMTRGKPTLCWDCAKATGGCSWCDEFKPVKGWTAKKTEIKVQSGNNLKSYVVIDCPLFERDAYNMGQRRA